MRAAIRDDCTGEPPGELINSATAAGRPRLNAFSITGPIASSLSRARGPDPIEPESRTTETSGPRFKNGMEIL